MITKYSKHGAITDEDIELSFAWARGEIKVKEVIEAQKRAGKSGNTSSVYQRLALGLRGYIRNNNI